MLGDPKRVAVDLRLERGDRDLPPSLSFSDHQSTRHFNRLALRILAVFSTMTLVGCHDTPTGPSAERYAMPRLNVTCQPSGPSVTCSARMYDVPRFGEVRDVTALATWIASDTTVAEFIEPGILRPKRRGEVDISATYQQLVAGLASWFLVDPQQTARRLYWVAGIIRDADIHLPLSDASVEILSGYASGARAVSNQFGSYRIDRILTAEVFSAQASKLGYASETVTYRVDSPVGPADGNPPFLDFNLRRIP